MDFDPNVTELVVLLYEQEREKQHKNVPFGVCDEVQP